MGEDNGKGCRPVGYVVCCLQTHVRSPPKINVKI